MIVNKNLKIPHNKDFKVYISTEQFARMMAYSKLTWGECGGLICGETENNSITVKKIVLLDQKSSLGNVNLEDNAINEFMLNNQDSTVVGWWHSHADMPAFFSSIDHDTSKKFAQIGYCLAIVVNRRGEYKVLVYHKTLKFDLVLEQEPELEFVFDGDFEEEIKDEIKKKVKNHFFQLPFNQMWYDGFSPSDGYY